MAYYKVRFEVWCNWDPAESSIRDVGRQVTIGEDAICTLQEVVEIVSRPEEIDDEEAMSFFGAEEGDADETQG